MKNGGRGGGALIQIERQKIIFGVNILPYMIISKRIIKNKTKVSKWEAERDTCSRVGLYRFMPSKKSGSNNKDFS